MAIPHSSHPSPFPSPAGYLSVSPLFSLFHRVEPGTRGDQDGADGADGAGGALVQLQIKFARILQERGLLFQFHGSLTSGLCTCDKKKVLYFEKKKRLCTNPS